MRSVPGLWIEGQIVLEGLKTMLQGLNPIIVADGGDPFPASINCMVVYGKDWQTKARHTRNHDVPTVLVTTETLVNLRRLNQLRVTAVLPLNATNEDLAMAVYATVTGNRFHHPAIRVMDDSRLGDLTPREIEVIRLLAQGLTMKEAGQPLGINPKTAEAHTNNAMKKLDLHKRAELTKFAISTGLVTLNCE